MRFDRMHELVTAIPAEILGPKMLALRDDRRRRFAFFMACGDLNATEAARQAGFSDIGDACKVRAHELMHDETVLDAVDEASRKILRGLVPLAVRRARGILDNPDHPHHARMIEAVWDRTGYSSKTEHTVKVEHTVDMKELEALARRLAQESGIPVQRLLGVDAAGAAKVIEGQVVDSNVSRETLTDGDT
jgi:hypothetical protein